MKEGERLALIAGEVHATPCLVSIGWPEMKLWVACELGGGFIVFFWEFLNFSWNFWTKAFFCVFPGEEKTQMSNFGK